MKKTKYIKEWGWYIHNTKKIKYTGDLDRITSNGQYAKIFAMTVFETMQ